jgi:hypothetical protein
MLLSLLITAELTQGLSYFGSDVSEDIPNVVCFSSMISKRPFE